VETTKTASPNTTVQLREAAKKLLRALDDVTKKLSELLKDKKELEDIKKRLEQLSKLLKEDKPDNLSNLEKYFEAILSSNMNEAATYLQELHRQTELGTFVIIGLRRIQTHFQKF